MYELMASLWFAKNTFELIIPLLHFHLYFILYFAL